MEKVEPIEAEPLTEPSFAAARHERDAMTPLQRFRAWLVFSTVGNPVLVKEFRTRMRGARARTGCCWPTPCCWPAWWG